MKSVSALGALILAIAACSDDAIEPLVPPPPATLPTEVAEVRQLLDSVFLIPGMSRSVAVALLDAELNRVNDRFVTWESSDAAVATVARVGSCGPSAVRGCYRTSIQAKGPGTALITATADGISSSMLVRVAANLANASNVKVEFEVIEFSPLQYAPLVTVIETAGRSDLEVIALNFLLPAPAGAWLCQGSALIPPGGSLPMFAEIYGDYQLSFSTSTPLTSNEVRLIVYLQDRNRSVTFVDVSGAVVGGGLPTTYTGGNPRIIWECS